MSRPFWWFRGDSVEQIKAELNAGPVDRIEVHLDGNDMTIRVIPELVVAEGGGGGTNDSHVCPPSCP